MLSSPMRWTAEMVRALPEDGRRHEVVDGEYFVNPAPRPAHQRVVMQLFLTIEPYVRTHRLGWISCLDSDLSPDPWTLVQPDLWVAPHPDPRRIVQWSEVQQLSLAVEVLSPGSLRADRIVKRKRYQRWGVSTYWIVDADDRVVHVWTPSDEQPTPARDQLHWHPDGVSTPLAIDLPQLFRDAIGD